MKDDKKKKKTSASKKTKEEDENINEESVGSIEESDDSFGLPDIDFKPLDEEEAQEEPATAPAPEMEAESVVESEDDIRQENETGDVEAKAEAEDYPVGQETETADEEVEETVAQTGDFEEDEFEGEDDREEAEDEPDAVEGEVQPVKSQYQAPKQPSAAPKIIIGALILVIIVAGVWYFGFYRPEQAALEKARQEQIDLERREAELAAQLERERQEELARQQQEADAEAAEEATPEPGTVSILTEKTGRYYVVIGSFIDGDLANDYGKELSEQGVGSMILSPNGKGFYRVTLSDHGTFIEAQADANNQKTNYGDSVWVIKY